MIAIDDAGIGTQTHLLLIGQSILIGIDSGSAFPALGQRIGLGEIDPVGLARAIGGQASETLAQQLVGACLCRWRFRSSCKTQGLSHRQGLGRLSALRFGLGNRQWGSNDQQHAHADGDSGIGGPAMAAITCGDEDHNPDHDQQHK